ncbi:hypothetical protein ACFLT3_00550 [Chloroflexota bacterium]
MLRKISDLIRFFLSLFRRKTVQQVSLDHAPQGQKAGNELRAFTCLRDKGVDDALVAAIRRDMEGKSSILQLMKSYIEELAGEMDSNAPPSVKMAKLFEYGITPEKVEGHYYGITLCLRSGEQKDIWAEYSNLLGMIWSTTLGDVSPWVGKSFKPMNEEELKRLTRGYEKSVSPTYTGINHFNEIDDSPLNAISLAILTFWIKLDKAPSEEKAKYGYEKLGGNFIARRAPSVHPSLNREVFQLNYRWAELNNLPPLNYLIDEIVEIADGMYLGQLLFATRHLLEEYDPQMAIADYDYQNFGYFLLFDESWRTEATRTFPSIGITPVSRTRKSSVPKKLTTFTFADSVQANCSDQLRSQIRKDMKDKETIMDLLQSYSKQLYNDLSNESPYFLKLDELFKRGVTPREISGFYRGALVTCNSEGIVGSFDLNALNMAWSLARLFTPWTGKIFEDIEPERLKDLTDGCEIGNLPTFFGANTYSMKTTRKWLAGNAMKVAGIWTEEPTAPEKKQGIDLKSFFFIGKEDITVNEDDGGKRVFRINYRWPRLKTFPPDNYCYDEIVQIADGLYLGQLMYATNLLKSYDPEENPAEYKYRNFGYFLLMDEDWHRRRLKIGFDLDNT